MPIDLIQDEEKLVYDEIPGSKIFYRRISSLRRAAIIKRYTKRGKANWGEITREILEYVVTGWETVNLAGKTIPFSTDLVSRLPEDVMMDILDLSGGAETDVSPDKSEKN